MTAVQQFGSGDLRSGSGSLLSGEVERIKGFLRYRGLLMTEGFGGWLVVVHPDIAEADLPLLGADSLRLVIGASLEAIRNLVDLTIGEIRALEALSPGPLILATGAGNASQATLVAVPDNGDLRDICSVLGGTATAFLHAGAGGHAELEGLLSASSARDGASRQLGVLQPIIATPTRGELPTVVRITGPGEVECLVEGALTMDRVRSAASAISQWEIGEWT